MEICVFTKTGLGSLDGETLRRRLGLHERGAADFFDALVLFKTLKRRGGCYSNTRAAALYLSYTARDSVVWMQRAGFAVGGGLLHDRRRRMSPAPCSSAIAPVDRLPADVRAENIEFGGAGDLGEAAPA